MTHGREIDARGGLLFDDAGMIGLSPAPADLADPGGALPPLAHGPLAEVVPLGREDWEAYCDRAFGIRVAPPGPFCQWLQSPLWRRTEPSAKGAGLREERPDHPRADSPVFLFDTDVAHVTQVAISVWGWVEALLRDAGHRADAGLPARNARRDPSPGSSSLARRDEERRRHALRSDLLLVLGALSAGAAIYLVGLLGR